MHLNHVCIGCKFSYFCDVSDARHFFIGFSDVIDRVLSSCWLVVCLVLSCLLFLCRTFQMNQLDVVALHKAVEYDCIWEAVILCPNADRCGDSNLLRQAPQLFRKTK
jgi:hypothetical protein